MSFNDQSQNRKTAKWDVCIQQLKLHAGSLSKIAATGNSSVSEIHQISKAIQKSAEINKVINCFLTQLSQTFGKSSKLSAEIRAEGNKIYKNNDGNLYESCFLYSLSMKCSDSEKDLSYAHGNRAAALMKLGFNFVARNDCEEAIRLSHPDRFKIFERLCSLSNGSIKDMRKNVAGLEKFSKKTSKQSKEIVQKYKTRLKAMEKETYVDEEKLISKLSIDDEQSFEAKLKVKQMYEANVGRYVVAQRSLKMHEKIFKETPFAFVPIYTYGVKKYFNTDCENCALVNIWPFLCLDCRHSSYCSNSCRENHKPIHKYECEGYKKNLFLEIGIAHLSLRVLLVGFKSLEGLLESLDRTHFKNNPEKIYNFILKEANKISQDYFNAKGSDEKHNEFFEYARVLSLQPNLLRNNTFPQKFYPYAYTARLLTIYLREETSFFQDMITNNIADLLETSEWELLISALLLLHIGQLISNGHAIIDFRQNVFTTDALKLMIHKNQANGSGLHLLLKSQRVFTGIFSRISMLNHSCNPNIRNSFDGNQLTITASREVSENEEIYNCYGPHWKLMSFQERHDTLRLQYNFECKCTKCEQRNDEYRFNNSVQCRFCNKRLFYPDNPIQENDDLEDEDDETFRLRCKDCKRVHENGEMKKFFSLLAQKSETDSLVSMNQLYATYLSAVEGLGLLDEIRFHMTEMMLHTLITNRHAINLQNANIPLKLTIELLTVKEEIYGQFSVEYIEAGFFLLDVLSILIDKSIVTEQNTNQLVGESMKKIINASEICSKNIQKLIRNYIKKFCYTYSE